MILVREAVATALDPLTHGMDGLRGAFIGLSHFGLVTAAAVLVIVAGASLVLGAYRFSKIQI
jgi:ABC-2 type transport system permease protein